MIDKLTFDTGDMRGYAIKEMDSCMAELTVGDKTRAAIAFGRAQVWYEMLDDLGIWLESEDEHFNRMLDIAAENGIK